MLTQPHSRNSPIESSGVPVGDWLESRHAVSTQPGPPEAKAAADVTRLLDDAAAGNAAAADELFRTLYDQLREIARRRMAAERPGHTLQATALVHEAYVRLIGMQDLRWQSRAHFLGAVARAMRRILVEQARRRARPKHGGDHNRVAFAPDDMAVLPASEDVLAVDAALQRLEAADARKGRLVNLRYFAGLSAPETARVLGVSLSTVERDWRFIKSWLQLELSGHAAD